jgi:hypothetical protein
MVLMLEIAGGILIAFFGAAYVAIQHRLEKPEDTSLNIIETDPTPLRSADPAQMSITFLKLSPLEWRQRIVYDREPIYRGRLLSCAARISDGGDIQLPNGHLLADIVTNVHLTIVPEELLADEKELSDRGIGLFFFDRAWFGAERELYAELWKQVASDNYVDCVISLALEVPVQDGRWVWDEEASNRLLITNTSIEFVRSREKGQEPVGYEASEEIGGDE